ncbi:S-layer homology domain-containing protein [Paenibacillus eucommiae]|uniref:SLH domain-containing protein n=1 Tax=Paenibacillus eucommiae TaxID=1355755 RepID=A0ABS4J2U9_9BACL|nr:S-layer homology domain-containing protein [Paenibacillus eucommiae]MBP1993431.1 hypothetical protein [Paenibacillus eucommiae]
MTMKKKLVVTTMAASLVLGTVAGLPLSKQGLASQFGISTSVASAATLPSSFLVKYNAIHSELTKDTEGIDDVRKARDAIKALTNSNDTAKKEELVTEIWNKVEAKFGNNPQTVSALDLYTLVSPLAITFDSDGTELVAALNNPDLRAIVSKLATLVGLNSVNDVSTNDIVAFYEAVISALETDKASIILAATGSNAATAIKDAIKQSINTKVLNDSTLKVSQVINSTGITIDDIIAVTERFNAFVNDGSKARIAGESALLRYMISTISGSGFTESRSNDGKFLTPGFKVAGTVVPANFLTWKVEPANTSIVFQNDRFELNSSSAATARITARDSIYGRLIYIGSITLTPQTTNPGNPGGPGGVITPAPGQAIADAGKAAQADLNKLKDQLKDATPEKIAELLAEAQKKVEEAVKKMGNIDLSKAITITDDKAIPKLVVGDLVKQIEEINKQVKALNESLKELDPNAAAVKPEFTLNLGTVNAKTTEVPLAKELLTALKDNGISKVDVALNGLVMSISATEFAADTTLAISKQDLKVASDATDKPIASDVYEFEFTSNGAAVNNFTTPIQLTIPVANSAKFDTELLTLAKILDGKLIIFVGKFKDGHLEASRNSFSTYTVVENKITFGDTAPVEQWAGRQIQVAAAKGILEGREANTFVPNGKVTRAEFAKMIVKTFGLEDEAATESFNDVKDSDWFKVYVASAVKHGIVNGRAEGVFDPNGQITRAEMATMAARALTLTGSTKNVADVDAALKDFVDAAAVNASLKAGVALAASEGIIVGEEGNKFNPNADSTRAQAAVVIYRLLNK